MLLAQSLFLDINGAVKLGPLLSRALRSGQHFEVANGFLSGKVLRKRCYFDGLLNDFSNNLLAVAINLLRMQFILPTY